MSLEKGSPSPPAIPSPNSGAFSGLSLPDPGLPRGARDPSDQPTNCFRLPTRGEKRRLHRPRPHPAVPGLRPDPQPRPGGGGSAARGPLAPGRQAPLCGQRPPGREPRLHGPGAGGGPGGQGLAPGAGPGGRPPGRLQAERDRRPVRPATPGRLPGRGPPAGPLDDDAGRHDRALRRGHRLRRPDRDHLRGQGRSLHGPPLRRLRVGDGQAPRRAGLGRGEPDRPGRLPRLQRQHLRRAAAGRASARRTR